MLNRYLKDDRETETLKSVPHSQKSLKKYEMKTYNQFAAEIRAKIAKMKKISPNTITTSEIAAKTVP